MMSLSLSWASAQAHSASCCRVRRWSNVLDAEAEYLPSRSSHAERGSVVSVRKSRACSGMTMGGRRRWVAVDSPGRWVGGVVSAGDVMRHDGTSVLS